MMYVQNCGIKFAGIETSEYIDVNDEDDNPQTKQIKKDN